jgi:hypothetical protein
MATHSVRLILMRAVIVLVVLLASKAFADDGLRCGQRLVSGGELEDSVAAKCGAPTRATRYVESCDDSSACNFVVVDLWTYDRGPTEFVRTLRFENAILCHVFVGDYGQ